MDRVEWMEFFFGIQNLDEVYWMESIECSLLDGVFLDGVYWMESIGGLSDEKDIR